jgi:3'(2'), 5'-bisphosphate nucleotidase
MVAAEEIVRIACEAGRAILDIYRRAAPLSVKEKEDHSPLTEADLAAHNIICDQLKQLTPGVPILSEESTETVPYETRKKWQRFWIVDPLDGTKEFIKKNGEFTVNIALIEGGQPTLGVIYAPVLNAIYMAELGKGAFKIDSNGKTQSLPIKHAASNVLKVVLSRSHCSQETLDYINTLASDDVDVEIVSVGSSLKFCLVAEGEADIYPRFGATMEWDIAAGDIIAREAGMRISNYSTKLPLQYNKEELRNDYFICERIRQALAL